MECEGLQIWPGLIDSHLHLGDLFDVSTNSIVCAVQDGVTAGISPGAGNSFMAPALLGAEIDRGLPLNAGVYLGAANILGTSMNEEEMIDLFQGKAAKELLEQKLSRNVFTNQMAPFIIGIKDHMGHFIMKDEDIDKIFDISRRRILFICHIHRIQNIVGGCMNCRKEESYIWDMPMQQEQAVTEMQKKQCSR